MAESKTIKLRGRLPKSVELGGVNVTIRRVSYGRIYVEVDGAAPEEVPAQTEFVLPDYYNYTNAELEALLIGLGVDPPARATKAVLLQLLDNIDDETSSDATGEEE